MIRNTFLLLTLVLFISPLNAQEFTRQDTLLGSITPERAWWDLTYYHLSVKVDIDDRMLTGSNLVQYRVLQEGESTLQIDLQQPMEITRVSKDGNELSFNREGAVYYVELDEAPVKGELDELLVEFGGSPKVAVRPPWDGGITWQQDSSGNPFVATSNQGIGASIWWPNKEHMYDEVDSMLISVNVREDLMDVSNGRLRGVDEPGDGTKTWHWFVSNPINNYGVNLNIGDYVHFSERYAGEKGYLDLDYYVLREDEDKAREQFKQVKPMMEAFEYWMGPYPFYEDGFKLVQAPYLGMEHQSSVTYGNGFRNGYRGRDLSESGWGMKFDFIIIHESAHEWFANNITYKDVADMWVHEGFTNYAENLYLNYLYGKEASGEYVIGTRLNIENDIPIIGKYGVRNEGSSDMYYKGSNMLHTIRQITDNDELWRSVIRGLNQEFYHQTVTTEQIENYISEKLEMDLDPVFDQYLRDIRIPTLEYAFIDNGIRYRWSNAIEGFTMPVDVSINGEEMRLTPRQDDWTFIELDAGNPVLRLDPNYYVGQREIDLTLEIE